MADYIPSTLAALIAWFQNWTTKIAIHGPALGVTAAEITRIGVQNTFLQHVINGQTVRQNDAQEWTAFKDHVLFGDVNDPPLSIPQPGVISPTLPDEDIPSGIIPWNRDIAQRIKRHGDYTEAIGEDLGIEAPDSAPAPSDPVLTGKSLTDFWVEISFTMKGNPMIEIQCKRADEADFTTIGFDTEKPYIDSRAPVVAGQPEVRQYRARYIKNGVPTSDWSDIIVVTARP